MTSIPMRLCFRKTTGDPDELIYVVIEPKTGQPVYVNQNVQRARLEQKLLNRRRVRGHRLVSYELVSRPVMVGAGGAS